ncbi:Cro/CI family transcriptional regulator [Burkholderia gladioli]|uniref:Cro/CI family transcriptional regulator n=1 Tax=Burkholderia gladioli TaxID=28095 RepID=UPI0034DABAE5
MHLTKQQAVDLFGSQAALARALGVTRGAIWQWADELDIRQTAMVVGAAVVAGKTIPPDLLAAINPAAGA